jgi:type IV pilus assembly protein PilV
MKHLTTHSFKTQRRSVKPAQSGIAILEALIAILIFSIGILGIVGLQARSVQGLGEATFRSQAVQHADELIAEMWTTDPGLRATLYDSATNGNRYVAWAANVLTGARKLPGASSFPPLVTVVSAQPPITAYGGASGLGAGGTSFFFSDVTVTLRWLPPGMPAGTPPSQYVTTARILEPQL